MVKFEVENSVGYITIQRAEKKNALNDELVTHLKAAFLKAYDNLETKVIVLKSEGDVFSAGADLAYLQQLQNNSFEENLADSRSLAQLFRLIYEGPKVVISAIQGHAIAGGCGLATVCDFSYAASNAMFGYTEVKIGFIPAIVSFYVLRKIGEAKAKELLLTGNLINAQEAEKIGLITKVVEANQLATTVENLAKTLVEQCSKQSLQSTKILIAKVQNLNTNDAMLLATEMNATARATDDCKKGINAFLNKEKIIW